MGFFGLQTKQEARVLSDLRAVLSLEQYARLEQIAVMIAECQQLTPSQKTVVMNAVLPIPTADFFKNTMQYAVVDSTQGQPVGFTLVTSINWN